MFVRHNEVSYAVRPLEARIPLWIWFIRSAMAGRHVGMQVLLALNTGNLTRFTEANALDLYHIPYTHGLPGSIVFSLILSGVEVLFSSHLPGIHIEQFAMFLHEFRRTLQEMRALLGSTV